jgi:hypothetical protein
VKGVWLGVLGATLVCRLAGHDELAEVAGGAALGLFIRWLAKGDQS